ncbi:MAG: anthrone oxygenase family protein [Pseudomonadota bacterium]
MNWLTSGGVLLGAGAALVGGVFLAFSDFVMRGLTLTEGAGGIEAMQHISRTVLRSVFLTTFLALVPASIAMAVYASFKLSGSAQQLFVAGAVIYCVTVFAVTMFRNVPMNNRLEALPPASTEAQDYWNTYGHVWTRWNHVRTVGSWAAAGCFLVAAVQSVG